MPSIRVAPPSTQAFRALAALEVYEAQVASWLEDPREGMRCGMQVHLSRLRRCCDGCGGLTVPWLALMIAHCELLHGVENPQGTRKSLAQLAATHRLCVRELTLACRRHLLHRQRCAVRTRHEGEAAPGRSA